MARLMVIPIEGRGDAVLVVTQQAGVTLMGFVAEATLREFIGHRLSPCECMAFVQRHLQSIERILLHKSLKTEYVEASIACVEIEAADLTGAGLAELRRA